MSLQYILGCSGSGKTRKCYDLMIQESLKQEDRPLIVIVPEQFTLETQKDLVKLHPSSGIMQIEVLSFQRLAYRIFDELGVANKTLLGNTGQGMVIRKILEDNRDKLELFYKNSGKNGFIKELKSIITELFQYDISSTDLMSLTNEDKPLLKTKLNDIALVYDEFNKYIKEKYITTEETLDLLSHAITKSKFLQDAIIWIDGFYGFTPIQYKVINEILSKVQKLYLTFTIDSVDNLDDLRDDSGLFFESKKAMNKINTLARNQEINIKENIFIEHSIPHRFRQNSSIAHLEKNIFRYPYKIYDKTVEGIHIYSASDIRQEVDHVANRIIELVRNENIRYKDIAIVTGDLNGYENKIEQLFKDYEIPFFIDRKKTILSHPLVELIRSALDIISKNWSYESVFGYLKTSLSGADRDHIDLLENYVLAYGIRGRKRWQQIWEYPYTNLQHEENKDYLKDVLDNINQVRERIIEPLLVLNDRINNSKVEVREITEALYGLLDYLGVEDKIKAYADKFSRNNHLLLEREYQQIYPIIMDLLDKIVEILGKEQVSVKEYSAILESGLEQCELGLVPPGLDQIVIGDLQRSRLKEVKVLFVLGLNEGKIPSMSNKANILSDIERDILEQAGLELAPNSKRKVFEEQFLIYMGLTKPKEKLYLSFSRTDGDGKALRPSILVSRIKKMYQDLEVVNIESLDNENSINQQVPTFRRLIEKMRTYYEQDMNDIWKDVYSWYFQDEEWREPTISAVKGLYHENNEDKISYEAVSKIYGDTLMNSVSRLESYSKCPFLHFIDYGLKVNERKVYELSVPDIGILFHRSIYEFSKKITSRGVEWTKVTDSLRDQLVEETVSEIANKYSYNIFNSTSRNAYLIRRLTRITKRAIWAIQYQIKKGEFKPTDYEVAFSADKGDLKSLKIDFDDQRAMKLRGAIDRVDKYETDDTVYVKVVDYKSGKNSFNITALYYGLQLQLLVYLNAVTELERSKTSKKVIPAGVFYYHIDDPMIKQDGEVNYHQLEKEIIKSLKMKGLVLEDIDIIKKMDRDIEGNSDIIPVNITTKGKIGSRSSVASEEKISQLQNYVYNKTSEIGREIMEGNINIYPYKDSKGTGCDYCDYSSICQFDEIAGNNEYRKLLDMSKEDIWRLISERTNK